MRFSARRTSRLALMTAVLCIVAPLELPVGLVPVTLQTFFVALTGAVLGPWDGFIAVIAYLLLGAVGLPVFAGWTGGIGMFPGATGGFLLGFPLLSLFCGLGKGRSPALQTVLSLIGLIAMDLIGTIHLMNVAGMDVFAALIAGVWPFLIKDIACIVLAGITARRMLRRLRL